MACTCAAYVPFWINGIAPPLPLARRVHAAGQMVGQAIASLPGDARAGNAEQPHQPRLDPRAWSVR